MTFKLQKLPLGDGQGLGLHTALLSSLCQSIQQVFADSFATVIPFCRWAWWRKVNSQKELLLGTNAARSSEYAIAIAASPPITADITLNNQQKDPMNVSSPMAVGTTPTASGPQAGSAFAAAASTAAPDSSPRNSTDLQRPATDHVGSVASRQASQGLAKSVSMAGPRGDGVADQLLQTLEKVNVLGANGKQVGAMAT